MTSFSPDGVIACPYCGGLALQVRLRTATLWHGQRWTDSQIVYPSVPPYRPVVKCAHCSECYWQDDAKDLGAIDDWLKVVRPPRPKLEYCREPTPAEYVAADKKKICRNPEEEREYRCLTWWRSNDASRKRQTAPPNTIGNRISDWVVAVLFRVEPSKPIEPLEPEAFRENIEALARLLSEDEEDLLLKAEIYRELGRFEDCLDILERITRPESQKTVQKLRALCEGKDTEVRLVEAED